MTAGKASGPDREYQERCRDLTVQLNPNLCPVAGDGIDVPVPEISGTTVTFDVLLQSPDGESVAAECKRWESNVPQEHLFAFAFKCEELRKTRNRPVAGFFMTKSGVQLGLDKVASSVGIQVVILPEASSNSGFYFCYHRYDADREQRIRDHIANVNESMTISESVCVVLKREESPRTDESDANS
jgi:hypothetical protein